ncbi:MAG: hypothetical protein HOC91_05390 [Nitrospinaceae bacterium]|jgi:hypothetical protein|nr:hypothetical protein [Nitrospinaceae bacterium]MBT3820953.1 hypothetical protein [Nitrospinaceae bacterium]MBT4092672.1 hypothetical protein [Nitrospinaceae bacterium]MBT4429930.1 hypothetical protein [Nitrospinaceae bacterium]MBT5369870.1 hypothetical protein [Nitrospinaceae bacterium]
MGIDFFLGFIYIHPPPLVCWSQEELRFAAWLNNLIFKIRIHFESGNRSGFAVDDVASCGLLVFSLEFEYSLIPICLNRNGLFK